MSEAIYQRAQLLLNQSRPKEAIELLENHIAQQADDGFAQYLLAYAYLNIGDKKKARMLSESLMEIAPDEFGILALSIDVELADELYEAADSRADNFIEHFPRKAEPYIKKSRAKLGLRNYDRAMDNIDLALEIEPEDVEALNLKIAIGSLLGHEDTNQAIKDALHLDPESASTIANHGMQLVREGKTKEALERLKYALSLDPTNNLARYAMSQALKSQFWPYRMFLKYAQFSAKLSSKGSWTLIIGAYIAYRLLAGLAESNEALKPFLMPLVYCIFGFFILTWILEPLMNAYLLTNKYGKYLLDEDDKKMAKLTAASLVLALILFGLSLLIENDASYYGLRDYALIFALMIIPFGTFLKVHRERNRKMTQIFTYGVLIAGMIVSFLNIGLATLLVLAGVFVYQFAINGMLIKENARVFGD